MDSRKLKSGFRPLTEKFFASVTVFVTTINMAADPGDPRALPDKMIYKNEQQNGPLRLGNSDSEFTLIKERTTTSTALGSI